jgi:hypothetical protein
MNDNYDDIIDLPRPRPKVRPPMPMINRAAQFAPFSALNGHEEAIRDTAKKQQRSVEEAEEGEEIDSL